VYAVIALIVGVAVGLLVHPTVPEWLAPYLPIAVVAALDAVFGGLRAKLDKPFGRSARVGVVPARLRPRPTYFSILQSSFFIRYAQPLVVPQLAHL